MRAVAQIVPDRADAPRPELGAVEPGPQGDRVWIRKLRDFAGCEVDRRHPQEMKLGVRVAELGRPQGLVTRPFRQESVLARDHLAPDELAPLPVSDRKSVV